jgi:hypothetical protein
MGLSTFIYGILPQGRKEDLLNIGNVKIINEFLKERKKQQTAKKDDLFRLRELRNNRSIDGDTYHRLKNVMILTHEKKRIELVDSMTGRIFRRVPSISSEHCLLESEQKTDNAIAEHADLEDGSETQSGNESGIDSAEQ